MGALITNGVIFSKDNSTESQIGVQSGSNKMYMYNKNGTDVGIWYNDDNTGYVIRIHDGTRTFYGDLIGNASNSDKLDGFHEYSFLRYRGEASINEENTLWDQIGIKEYSNKYPLGAMQKYGWGHVISLPSANGRLDLYATHYSSEQSYNGLQYRTGWTTDAKPWRMILDSGNFNGYVPSLTGSGAYGTWGINITGDSNTVDGYHASNFSKETDVWIDASNLDQNTYYPVTMWCDKGGLHRFKLAVELNSSTKPSWSTHEMGFTCNIDVEMNYSGWGATSDIRYIMYQDDYNFATVKPAYFAGQGYTSSQVCFMVRGGGRYHFITNYIIDIVLRTSATTMNNETFAPTIATDVWYSGQYATIGANISGNAHSANSAAYAPSAGNADTVDNHHASDFLRKVGATAVDGEATPWSDLGIKEYHNGYPDGITNKMYGWGAVTSLPGLSSRLEFFSTHTSSGANVNGLQYRTGWGDDKYPWQVLLDSSNFSAYALPLTGGSITGTIYTHNYCPLYFYGYGTGTYNCGCMYVNNNGITFETPHVSDDYSSAILPFKVMTRGAAYAPIYYSKAIITNYGGSDRLNSPGISGEVYYVTG